MFLVNAPQTEPHLIVEAKTVQFLELTFSVNGINVFSGLFGTIRDVLGRIKTNLDEACKEFRLSLKKATQNTKKKFASKLAYYQQPTPTEFGQALLFFACLEVFFGSLDCCNC
jgi:hypothetical protein